MFVLAKGVQYWLRTSKDMRVYNRDYPYFHKCLFIHIPRTSGVVLQQTLFGHLGCGHMTYQQCLTYYGPNIASFKVVTIVRNPWSRLWSAFNFLKKGGFHNRNRQWADQNLSPYDTFESFVLEWLNEESIWDYVHFHPQWYFLEGAPLDYIGRFEELEVAHAQLKQHVWRPRNNKVAAYTSILPTENSYKNQYSAEMISKVESLYEKDIRQFKYSF